MTRAALAVAALLALTSTTGCGVTEDELPARTREAEVVAISREAFEIARTALGGGRIELTGGWSPCPEETGHQFSGEGKLEAPVGTVRRQLAAVREAFTSAGFEEISRVERMVGGTRDRVVVVVKEPFVQRPRTWYLSFGGPCLGYGGDDLEYIESRGPHLQTLPE